MAHRLRLLCIAAVSLLASVALVQGQSASFAGLGFAGGLGPDSYQSMGTVPALLGEARASTPSKFHNFSRGSEPNYGYYPYDLAFWFPGYFAAYYGGSDGQNYVFPRSSPQQDGDQQQSSGAQGQNQGGNQNQNQNQNMNGNQSQTQNPNQNQNKQGQGKEEAPPEKPQYLTYSPKKKTLQEQAKSGKALAVDFKSAPTGAEITVDGYFVGHTPATAKIPVGKHLVSISKWGYESWQKELDVTGNKPLSVNPTLHKDW